MLTLRNLVGREDAYSALPYGVEHREEAPRFGAPEAEHPRFTFVLLDIGFQWLDPDRVFGLLRNDAVPGDVLDVGVIPIEVHNLHSKDDVKPSQAGGQAVCPTTPTSGLLALA